MVPIRRARRAAAAETVPGTAGWGRPGGCSRYAAFKITRPSALDGTGIRGGQRGHTGTWFLSGRRHLPVTRGSGVGHDLIEWAGPVLEQREGRPVRGLLPDLQPVDDRGDPPPHLAAINPGRDRATPTGRWPGTAASGDLLLALHRERWGYGPAGSRTWPRRPPRIRCSTTSGASKAAPLDEVTCPPTWSRAGRTKVSHPGTFEGFPDRLGAQVAGRARREEVGLLLQRRGPTRQQAFLDHSAGRATEVSDWPPVATRSGTEGTRGPEGRPPTGRCPARPPAAVPGRRRDAVPGAARRGVDGFL